MSEPRRIIWEERHRGQSIGEPEPFVTEMLGRMPRGGLALEVACGRGRNALALARAGLRVIGIDYSHAALLMMLAAARAERLPVAALEADLSAYPLPEKRFDVILNVSYLERELIPRLKRALAVGGLLLCDTFLIDQAAIGHPSDPRFLLERGELRRLLEGLELETCRETLVTYPGGRPAWRASALARRRS